MKASYELVVTQHAAVAAAVLLVASCGIDQGGYHDPGAAAPDPTAQTVLVSGPIDAFGPLNVNGLALDTSRTQLRIDGRAASEADLRLGQMIRVVARVDGTTASAVSIDYEENVIGPVAQVDLAAREFTVLGLRARVTATTRFDGAQLRGIADLRAGDRVTVSGLTLPENAVLATYVGRAAATEPFEITTTVTALGPSGLTFDLGALTIDYSRASVVELPGGRPIEDAVVEVTGSVVDNGVLVAERVRALPLLPGAFTAAATALTSAELSAAASMFAAQPAGTRFVGVITARNADSLMFADLETSLTPATVVTGTPANLIPGVRVMVIGKILAPGRIEATRIETQ
jgi:hypothetical protein